MHSPVFFWLDRHKPILPPRRRPSYTPSKNDFTQIYSKTLPDEEKSTMSLWSMSAAPLLIGGDVRSLSAYDKYVLENTEVVAIDQDAKGLQAKQVGSSGSVYYKPLSDGSVAVMLLNRSSTAAASLHVNWADIGIAGGTAQVRDLWAHPRPAPIPSAPTMRRSGRSTN